MTKGMFYCHYMVIEPYISSTRRKGPNESPGNLIAKPTQIFLSTIKASHSYRLHTSFTFQDFSMKMSKTFFQYLNKISPLIQAHLTSCKPLNQCSVSSTPNSLLLQMILLNYKFSCIKKWFEMKSRFQFQIRVTTSDT